MIVDLLGGSYKHKYIEVNSQKTINWYPVTPNPTIYTPNSNASSDQEKNKTKFALFPTPGLSTFCDPNGGILRGLYVARTVTQERCFAVGTDTHLYEISSAGSITDRGAMSISTTGQILMKVNGGNQLIIVDTNILSSAYVGYTFALDTNILTLITDTDYPGNNATVAGGGISSLEYMDGYFFIIANGRVYFSALNDGTNWNAADTFTPTSKADAAVCIKIWQDQVFIFGSETIETYINDGTSPFVKSPRTTIDIGCVNSNSVSVYHDGVIFLGKTASGEVAVYFYDGRACSLISSPSITWDLNNTTVPITNSYSFIQYTKDGHIWYNLTIPSLHTTYVFDLIDKFWFERQSYNPNTSTDQEYRGQYFTNFKGLNLFTDLYTSKLLKEDFTVVTENSNPITRTRISSIYNQEFKNISIFSLELDCNVGTGLVSTPSTSPNLNISYSYDSGHSYKTARTIALGASGAYTTRARLFKLGTGRNWVIKIVLTDAADVIIQNAIVNGAIGLS